MNLYLLLKSAGDLATTLHCKRLRFVQLGLHIFHLKNKINAGRKGRVLYLEVKTPPVLLSLLCVLLLSSELICKAGGVNHRLLGPLLSHHALADHLLQIGLNFDN